MGWANLIMNQTIMYPAMYYETVVTVKVTAGTTCILSLLGASLIIYTYVAFKDLRTTARQLLVNLCVADIIVVVSHFVGLFANFERFLSYGDVDSDKMASNSSTDGLCIAQSVFSIYGTVASFLWSILIAVHLSVMIITRKKLLIRVLVPVFYFMSWGLPIFVLIYTGVKGYFGFQEFSNPGWCYATHKHFVGQILTYELWLILAFVVLTILYLVLFCYIRCKVWLTSTSYWSLLGVAKSDVKLLFVPVIFFLLRIWNQVIDGILHYSRDKEQADFKQSVAAAVLVVFSGIGLNAQGFSNALLFCLFTKQIRQRLYTSFLKSLHPSSWCKRISGTKQSNVQLEDSVMFSSANDSKALLEESDNKSYCSVDSHYRY